MARRLLIVTTLHISPRVAEKLENDHGLDADEVRAAIEGVGRLPYRAHVHPDRGWRAMVATVVGNEPVRVVLYPSRSGNDEEWHLGSAYPDDP
ncbi:MAG: hypothetical protein MUP97_09815 [Acidimicrobiia bacterium]|nr:hypothetical protein [Acidimicrobiia bacterium]